MTYSSELDGSLGGLHKQGSTNTTVDAELLAAEDVEENLEGSFALSDFELLNGLDDVQRVHDQAFNCK